MKNCARSLTIRSAVAAATLLVVACSNDWRGGPKPPFELGRIEKTKDAPLASLELATPKASGPLEVKPKGKFECSVSIAKDGGRLPTFLLVRVASIPRGEDLGSVPLDPTRIEDGKYICSGICRVPAQRGMYDLEVVAQYLTLKNTNAPQDQSTDNQFVVLKVAKIRVEGK